MTRVRCLRFLLLFGLILLPLAGAAGQSQAANTLFLPLAVESESFSQVPPIWPVNDPPAAHEVALFRAAFSLESTRSVTLDIFADTRYQVWIDGVSIGRGPARFSWTLHEYDSLNSPELQPGTHTVAVLVQWSPNQRRSESTRPHLRARITAGGQRLIQTGLAWKALLSPAWRADAAPVHAWNLIGATELLDLRQLPAGWQNPGFDDQAWNAAVFVNPLQVAAPNHLLVAHMDFGYARPEVLPDLTWPDSVPAPIFQPRNLPLLNETAILPTVVESGLISPDRAVQYFTAPASLTFTLASPAAIALEMLSPTGLPAANTPDLSGQMLNWQPAGDSRPDVFTAAVNLPAGENHLSAAGLHFAVYSPPAGWPLRPLETGAHTGSRLLLADLSPRNGAVSVASSAAALTAVFNATPSYLVLDLGRTRLGRLTGQITGPAGSFVDIGWDERLYNGLRPLPYPGHMHPEWNEADTWILDGASRDLTTLDARSGRYILIAVWGNGPVTLSQLQFIEENYPAAQTGNFTSSDSRLNQIWQTGATTLIPNMNDAYADPWRERGQWWGDAFVTDRVNSVTFGDSLLLKRGLIFMANALEDNGRAKAMAPNGQGVYMLDYGMLWVQSIHDAWLRTGDKALLEKLYIPLTRYMAYLQIFCDAESGLLNVPEGAWAMSAYVDVGLDADRHGFSTAVNAMYYGTLRQAAALASAVNDPARAAAWGAQADALRGQINARLYDAEQHRYNASIRNGEKAAPSVHAQAWALAYSVPAESERSAVTASLVSMLSTDPLNASVQTYGMYWLLEALGQNGQISPALAIIRSYYGRMLDLGATTWWENFYANYYYYNSYSHAWGASPTWFMSTYVLGLRQTGPHTWLFKPAFDGLDAVSGSLPLSGDALAASWTRQGCTQADLTINAPAGSSGEVIVPLYTASTTVTLNGAAAWQNNQPLLPGVSLQADGLHLSYGAGTATVTLQPFCQQ
ncbi:MAG TPA: hypothetical protein PKW33_17600 [Anaerolineaceae bacterium]|nr:hypothetical protein [Anaerolineaceae bacterium]HPN53414.1 hypothetical protein [Anaerolineaceae bacterium]